MLAKIWGSETLDLTDNREQKKVSADRVPLEAIRLADARPHYGFDILVERKVIWQLCAEDRRLELAHARCDPSYDTSKPRRTRAPTPVPCAMSPNNKCSVPMD